MSRLALIVLAFAVGCNAQSPRILAPIGWNGGNYERWPQQFSNPQTPWNNQPWNNGQQSPWNNQPWTYPRQEPYPYYHYPQHPQNQWPGQNSQQPWRNNWNHSPQNPQGIMENNPGCVSEAQTCFNQMPEYFESFQTLENTPAFTKGEIAEYKKKLSNRLPDNIQKCYNEAENKLARCIAQQRRSLTNRLSRVARNAFNRIKKIHDNKQITKQEEYNKIAQILHSLNPSISHELLAKIPGLRHDMQFNQGGQFPYNNGQPEYGQYGQNPYNQFNQNPYNQFNQNPYGQYGQK